MPSSVGSYGTAGDRHFSCESIDRLAKHDLFDFQIQQSTIGVRVSELHELLINGRDLPDLADLLDQFVHELEDDIHGGGGNELFLLAALQHFRQQMEWCLEVDEDARLAATGVARNIFAPKPTKAKPAQQQQQVHSKTARPARRIHATTEVKAPRMNAGRMHPQQMNKANVVANAEDEIVCGVCFQADSLEHDPIVICDWCNTAVHQSCYRIDDVPDDDWFCHPCQRYLQGQDVGSNVTPTYELECQACRVQGGAFIATVDDKWVHMACSMYLPELYVQASHKYPGQEVISGVEYLQDRRQLRCCFCKKKNRGACAQCCVGKCATSYHVLCALKNHTKFIFMDENDQFGSACTRHFKGFYGRDPPTSMTATTTDEEATPRPRSRLPKQSTPQPLPQTSKRTKTPGKKRLLKPHTHSDSDAASDDEDDDDGVLLDEESDNSSMFSSDVESDIHTTPQRKKSPVRPTAVHKPVAQAEPQPPSQRAVSPGKQKSPKRGRPPKKQQTLMVPAFGMVKQITKPPGAVQPSLQPTLAAVPTPHAVQASTPAPDADAKTQVLLPFNAGMLEAGAFEDVLLVIPRVPLGLSLRTETRAHGAAVAIQGLTAQTTNPAVVDALRRGILHDGDEIVALNDVSMRCSDVVRLKQVLSGLQPPYRIAIKTKTKRSLTLFGVPAAPPQPVAATAPPPAKPVVADHKPKLTQTSIPVETSKLPTDEAPKAASTDKTDRTPVEEALSIDWPWFYLRSDGKLAMHLMWKSLEAGFFVPKMDPTTFRALLGSVETHLGFRLSRAHKEYACTTQALLDFPSRELPVPSFIKEFRDHKKNKRRSLANDPIFLNASVEQVNHEDEWDDRPPLAIGATVQVAKRTWPGINKLGGAARIKKVHEVKSEDGIMKRYVYDVQYVLGGGEKKVERKWIAAVTSMNESSATGTHEQADATTSSFTSTTDQDKTKKPEEDTPIKLRVGMRIQVEDLEVELPTMARSTERKVHLQVAVLKNSVSLERRGTEGKREMLWHQHFPIKQSGVEALLSDALAGSVEYMDELGEDDEDDEEDETSEIAVQLRQAQHHFQLVMQRNEELFAALQSAAETEYASRDYRKRRLAEIEGRHYGEMYREMAAARKELEEESEEENEDGTAEGIHAACSGQNTRVSGKGGAVATGAGRTQEKDLGSDSDVDDSCGGMFINKIKQEGNEVVCVLCELTGGDFAATACGRVVHPQCAMYTPETFFKDGVAHGVDQIPMDERRALTCAICGGKKGTSKIQCASQRCLTAYHVACAFVNGQLTRDPHYQAWCPKHLKTSGMQSEIEWPPHMKPTSTGGGGGGGGGRLDSGSGRKRKRRRSTGGSESKSKEAENNVGDEVENDPREPSSVSRRLVVDDDDDHDEDDEQGAESKPKTRRRV